MVLSWLRSAMRRQLVPRSSSRQGGPRRGPNRSYALHFDHLEDRAVPATATWSGLGLSPNWTEGANWVGGQAPAAGDDLVFPAGASQTGTMQNNLQPALQLRSLTFQGSGYTLNGNIIQLSNGINANNLTGTNTINLAGIILTNNQTIDLANEINGQGTALTVNNFFTLGNNTLTITGPGQAVFNATLDGTTFSQIVKEGVGRTFLRANSANFSGQVTVNQGELFSNQGNALGNATGTTVVNAGASLVFEGGTYTESFTVFGNGFAGSGALNASGTAVLNGSTIVRSNTTFGAFSGVTLQINGVVSEDGGSFGLNKVGIGTVRFDSNVLLSGATVIQAGLLQLVNTGTMVATPSFRIMNGGTLELNNTGSIQNDRIGDNTPIMLESGHFRMAGRFLDASFAERVGAISLVNGHNQITLDVATGSTNGTFLALESPVLIRNAGATVTFNQNNSNTSVALNFINLGTLSATQGMRIQFDSPPALDPAGTVPGGTGIIPWAQINTNASTTANTGTAYQSAEFATYGMGSTNPTTATGIMPFSRADNAILPDTASPGYATSTLPLAIPNPIGAGVAALPVVNPVGGGATGGNLEAGTYFARFTYYNGIGETLASLPSANFVVAAGNIPTVTVPAAPAGASGFFIYLSNSAATPGSETRYGGSPFGGTVATLNLAQFPAQGLPTTNSTGIVVNVPNPNLAATVDPVGGGAAGGTLAASTGAGYFLQYTFVDGTGGETLPSPASASFIVAAGNIPRVTLPALPGGAVGMNIYLSNPGGTAGSQRKYNTTLVTGGTFDLDVAAPAGVVLPTFNTTSIAAPVTNPVAGPTVNVTTATGGLAAGTYMVSYSFVNATGETLASPLASFTVAGTTELATLTLPVLPAGASSYNVYLTPAGGMAGDEVRYNTTAILANNLSSTAGGMTTFALTAAPPGSPTNLVTPPATNTTHSNNPINQFTNVRYSAAANELITTSRTINSLSAAAGGTISINPGVTLTIRSGSLLNSTGTLTITGGGTLQFQSPTWSEAFILGGTGVTLNVPIIGATSNGLTIAVLNGQTVTFGGGSAANSYSGVTRLNSGTLTLAKALNTIAIPGDLVVGDGTGSVAVDQVNVNQFGQLLFVSDPVVAPTVTFNGGGSSGGSLAGGNYFLKFTYVSGNGGETLASPESIQFTTDGFGIPRVNIGALPVGVTAVKIYLTQTNGLSNSETLYGTFAAGANIDLAAPWMPGQPLPPTINTALSNVTIMGGGTLTLLNTAGIHSINTLTMKSSNSNGGNNINTGDARVNGQAGTLSLAGNVNVLAPDTSSLYFAGQSTISGNLRLASVAGVSRTISVADGAAVNDMIISAVMSTPANNNKLIKSGLGTLLLTAVSPYNGPTEINQGNLAVYGTNSLSPVTLLSGTELAGGLQGGTGTILNGNFFGTVRPGALPGPNDFAGFPNFANQTRGVLQSQGGATFQSNSKLILEIAGFAAPGTEFDRFLTGGTLTISPGTTLILDLQGLLAPGLAPNIMTWASRLGTFSDIQTINNPKGFIATLKYNSGSLDITIRTAEVPTAQNLLVVGPNLNRKGDIQVYNARDRALLYTINAFGPKAPVEVATGDFNGDGVLDVIAAQNGLVRVFDGTTGKKFTTAYGEFRPFGAFSSRVFVASGQLDNNIGDDIVVGKGKGNALVRAWSTFNFNVATPLLNFNPYPGATTGVRVAVGNVDGTGTAEVIVAPGAKRVFEIQVWNTFQIMVNAARPYGNTYRNGGFLATGDFNNDGKDDVVVGPGPSKPAKRVMVLKGDALGVILGPPGSTGFVPFLGYTGNVRVAATDSNGDGFLDVVATRLGKDNLAAFFNLAGSQLLPPVIAFEPYNGGLNIGAGVAH